MNLDHVLQLIWEHATLSRQDLSRLTGYSVPSITLAVKQLLAEENVIESGWRHSRGGRKQVLLTVNPQLGFAVGIDIGSPYTR